MVSPSGPLEVHLTEASRGGPFRGGAEYRVDVVLKPSAPPGPIAEQVTLKTNDPTNPLVHITVTGTVVAPLELAPSRVRLDEGLASLPERQRIALVLFDAEGWGHADIAAALGVPEGTVRSYVFHARRAMRKVLGVLAEGKK